MARENQKTAKALSGRKKKNFPSPLAKALWNAVRTEGPTIYRDGEKLAAFLRKNQFPETTVRQVQLAAAGSSLVQYLDQLDQGLNAIEMNNILLTAQRAGLAPSVARQVTADILFSLNVPQIRWDVPLPGREGPPPQSSVYIPPEAYREHLEQFLAQTQQRKALEERQFSLLNAYVDAEIPLANTLMGYLYLQGLGVPKNEEKAVKYLESAAQHGEPQAFGLLGDYYYTKNRGEAYRFYSMPGSIALNKNRQNNFRCLESSRDFYRAQAKLSVGLFLVCQTVILLLCSLMGAGVDAAVFSAVNAAALASLLIVHKRAPFRDLRGFALPFLVTVVLCFLTMIWWGW